MHHPIRICYLLLLLIQRNVCRNRHRITLIIPSHSDSDSLPCIYIIMCNIRQYTLSYNIEWSWSVPLEEKVGGFFEGWD